MSRETEHMYRFKCDSAKCSNTLVSDNSICPSGWIYTYEEDEAAPMKIYRMHQKYPRQISEIRDLMHFCCVGCLIDYLAEQISRLDVPLGTEA